MKKIFSILFTLVLAVSLVLVPGALGAQPDEGKKEGVPWVLWGVDSAREVFTVNTATGVVTIVNSGVGNPLYGDIAMTRNGRLYATGADPGDPLVIQDSYGNWVLNFNDFYRLDPATGAILSTWRDALTNAGFERVNALCAESNKSLLAIEGGGVCTGWGYPTGPKLLRIHLDAKGNFLGITNLGAIAAPGAASCCSDGDLDRDPKTGKWYAGFWKLGPPPVWGVSEMIELNLANPGNSAVVSDSGMPCQGGFAFRFDGTAYAGSWAGKILYTVDVLNGGSTVAYDLSGDLAGDIYGLSSRI